jgi:survival of motor neuron protein-interacting protein 1
MVWVPAESVEELMPWLLPVEPCDLTEGSKQPSVQML